MTGIIGRRDGSIPFHDTVDMKRFRELTKGASVIVGRKTFDTLPRLPGRTVYVLTRGEPSRSGADGFSDDPVELLRMAASSGKGVFIIGGAEVYRIYAPIATRVYETIFEGLIEEMEGDVKYMFDAADRHFTAAITRGSDNIIFRDYTLP